MQQKNKRIRLIVLIFFIFTFSSIILGINYFKISENKWTVVYRISTNTKSLNSLKYVDYELKRFGYVSLEESVEKDITDYINFNDHHSCTRYNYSRKQKVKIFIR